MSRPLRVVLDTNVVLSALLFSRGTLEPVRLAWQAGAICPLLSTATADELVAVLAYPKFKLAPADREELLADFLPYCSVVRAVRRTAKLPTCRDPHDVPFLQLAFAGKAAHLVTGDKDLLAVRGSLPFRIVSPSEFLALLPVP
jgi:putative PIN family toxin of toxin-antitoxin system